MPDSEADRTYRAHVCIKTKEGQGTLPRVLPRDLDVTVNGVKMPWRNLSLKVGLENGPVRVTLDFWADRLDIDADALLILNELKSSRVEDSELVEIEAVVHPPAQEQP